MEKNKIPPGCTQCSVNGCDTNLKSKPVNVHLFAIPKTITEDWRSVLNKPEDWMPRKHSKICSLHFTPGDVIGRKLRPGAIPLPSFPTLFVASGKTDLNTEWLRIID